jgi:hypothetical protein
MPEETFTIPLEIVKAERTSDGQMRIHGIATDETLDLQNEVVKANGLANCLEYLKTWGKFNDDHKRIFLGDIDQAEVTTRGALVAKGVPCKQGQDSTPCVYVGGFLFPKVARARHYWDVIESGGRVGMSVQGRPLATPVTVKSRDGQTEHRMWTKLFANQVALTVQPINTSTWVGIQKSFAGGGTCTDCSACPNIGSCCPGGECLRDVITAEVVKSKFGVKIPRHLRCISRKIVPGRKQRVYEFASSTPLAHVSQLADGLRRKGHVVSVHPAPVSLGTAHVITARSKRGTEYRFHIYQRFARSLGTGSAIVGAGTPDPAGAALRTQSLEGAVKQLTPRLTIKKKRKKKMLKSIERREDVSAAEKKRAAGEYGDVTYADPVNKKYPLDAKHIHAAIAYFSKPENQAEYSPEERKLMWGRIRRAAKKHGVEMAQKSLSPEEDYGTRRGREAAQFTGATHLGSQCVPSVGQGKGYIHRYTHPTPGFAARKLAKRLGTVPTVAGRTRGSVLHHDSPDFHLHLFRAGSQKRLEGREDLRKSGAHEGAYELTQSVCQEEAKSQVPTLDFQSIKTMMPGEIVKAWRTLTQPKEAVLHPPEEVRAFKVALAAAAREHSPAWAAGIAKSQGWSPAADMTELDIGVWMALAETSEDDVAKAISRGEVEVCKSLSAGYGVDQTTPHEGWQELLKKAVEGNQSGCEIEAPEKPLDDSRSQGEVPDEKKRKKKKPTEPGGNDLEGVPDPPENALDDSRSQGKFPA